MTFAIDFTILQLAGIAGVLVLAAAIAMTHLGLADGSAIQTTIQELRKQIAGANASSGQSTLLQSP